MALRNIIVIDESLCDGCGACVPSCAEGAIRIVDGKARLVADSLCDGLGACIGECPRGALTVVTREAAPFSEEEVLRRRLPAGPPSGCPSARWSEPTQAGPGDAKRTQWPVQLRLLSPSASFLRGATLLLTADCVPVADPFFRNRLAGPCAIAIACPKFDDPEASIARLSEIITGGGIAGIRVLRMEVPCCGALTRLAGAALTASSSDLRIEEEIVTAAG